VFNIKCNKKRKTHTDRSARFNMYTWTWQTQNDLGCQLSILTTSRPTVGPVFFCCNVLIPSTGEQTSKNWWLWLVISLLGMSLHYGNFPWELIARIDGELPVLIFQYCYIDEYVPH
jgi:hypothetical protein